jgi:RimJ/RimL family protein N-acetyltransferase
MGPGLELATHVRRLGPKVVADELRGRVSSEGVNFGLRCDLERLPRVKPAAIPLTLEPREGPFGGFDSELAATTGRDYGRVLRRKRLHERGVRTMHVAIADGGAPVYVQWLITRPDQDLLAQYGSEFWPPLAEDEVLLEFAYTFTAFRGRGVMADAMSRLLSVGAALGARSALTYVRSDNVPSLRGCHKVGFRLDHVRTTSVRLGRQRHALRPPNEDERALWDRSTGARPA